MTSQTGTQIVTINILPDISKTKVNQSVKFGHLIVYNVRNISSEIMQKMRQGD